MKTTPEEHRGKIVLQRINDCGFSKKAVYKALKKSQVTLDAWLENPRLGYEQIRKIGKIINYDFARDFPQMAPLTHNELISGTANKTAVVYEKPETKVKCWQMLEEMRGKYIHLLEENKALSSAYISLLNK